MQGRALLSVPIALGSITWDAQALVQGLAQIVHLALLDSIDWDVQAQVQEHVFRVPRIVTQGFTEQVVQVQVQGHALLVLPITQLDSIRQDVQVQVQGRSPFARVIVALEITEQTVQVQVQDRVLTVLPIVPLDSIRQGVQVQVQVYALIVPVAIQGISGRTVDAQMKALANHAAMPIATAGNTMLTVVAPA